MKSYNNVHFINPDLEISIHKELYKQYERYGTRMYSKDLGKPTIDYDQYENILLSNATITLEADKALGVSEGDYDYVPINRAYINKEPKYAYYQTPCLNI